MKTFITSSAKIFAVICVTALVFISFYQRSPAAPHDSLPASKDVLFQPDQNDLASLTRLLATVNRFKSISLVDYETAFFMFAADEAIQKFINFNEAIWIETPPQVGWSFFMSVAVHAVGGVKGEHPLVAFYNPWSDVFLITVWRMDEDVPNMIDAEMLTGDWLRAEDPKISLVPSWLRTNMFKPLALGNSVAEAIRSFERVFPVEPVTHWRKKLPVLENRQILVDVNYPAVAIMLFNSLQNIDDFRTAGQNDNPRLESCRNLTIDTVHAAVQGHLDELLIAADETLPETKAALKSLLPEWFRTLEAVAVITAKDGCLVFLAPVFDATASISFFLKGSTQKLVLKRIDVVDYRGFYQNLNRGKEAARREP